MKRNPETSASRNSSRRPTADVLSASPQKPTAKLPPRGQVHPTARSRLLRPPTFQSIHPRLHTQVPPPMPFWRCCESCTPSMFTPQQEAGSSSYRSTVNSRRLQTDHAPATSDQQCRKGQPKKTDDNILAPRPGSPHSKKQTPPATNFPVDSPKAPHPGTAPVPFLEERLI
jgi:hypothetical protein